jgi:RNA polymerase sigma-70 factor (ECF subfamily)
MSGQGTGQSTDGMKPAPQTGDSRRADFDALYQRYNREVWALAYTRWMDADVALDITQESFLRLWRQWESGEEILNPRAWLLRVARNLTEDHVKSAFRRNGTMPNQVMNGVPAPDWSPLDTLERDETFAQLHAVLSELSETDRHLLTLRYALDYDAGQIAEALGINTTAVHMRLSRARQRVAERLSAPGAKPKS